MNYENSSMIRQCSNSCTEDLLKTGNDWKRYRQGMTQVCPEEKLQQAQLKLKMLNGLPEVIPAIPDQLD